METLSLIDEKKPRPKRAEGDAATKRQVLPPISRIRAEPPAGPIAKPVDSAADGSARHASSRSGNARGGACFA